MSKTVQQEVDAAKRAEGQDGKVTFSFGENWKNFVDTHLDAEREDIARASMVEFLERTDLRGATFLDIGCGSGLFSLGAYRLGADRIVSVDVDPHSVASTTQLRAAAGSPGNWKVLHGSILDRSFAAQLEPA